MKKLLYIFEVRVILAMLIAAAIAVTQCSIEKDIQVKPVVLTLVSIQESSREAQGILYWLHWTDDLKTPYSMYCFCPNYKIGDKQIFLVTR